MLDAGRIVLAADTLGAAQTMLDRAVAFAKERVQFGRIIGSFQGVKYMLADCVTMLEPCRGMVWYAAHAQDARCRTAEARLTALHAKAHLGDVGRDVARMTTEAHGGMGFTDLLGLHYWFKRISFNRQVLGGPERCREEAADLQGWAHDCNGDRWQDRSARVRAPSTLARCVPRSGTRWSRRTRPPRHRCAAWSSRSTATNRAGSGRTDRPRLAPGVFPGAARRPSSARTDCRWSAACCRRCHCRGGCMPARR